LSKLGLDPKYCSAKVKGFIWSIDQLKPFCTRGWLLSDLLITIFTQQHRRRTLSAMKAASQFPSLPALRAFAATAQSLSFSVAAQNLYMTQSAVSHHITQLETLLGCALFVRYHRSIALTAAGEVYLAQIAPALASIAAATQALSAQSKAVRPLRIALLPSFAANWLVPRLGHFRARHPAIALELMPSLALADVAGGEVDFAIRYGAGRWQGVRSQHLQNARLTPVASPQFLARFGMPRTPIHMLKMPLLLNLKPVDWQLWLQHVGIKSPLLNGMQLTDYNIALQAALDGQGVLLGRIELIAARLARGELHALFPNQVLSDRRAAYWLVRAKTVVENPAAEMFIDWLTDQFMQEQSIELPPLLSPTPTRQS
jgi:LysR family transcriptional regulator, glycine cleavage system transcriptional activator